ncbi:MAG: hypothetical protein ACE5FF_09935, partial [Saprospiraceae bacterium]
SVCRFFKTKSEIGLKQQNTYRIWAAIFLATLVLQVTLVQQVHLLLAHHQVAEHCLSFNGQQHIHSEEYAPVNCQICLFHIAPAELTHLPLALRPIPGSGYKLPFFYKNPSFQFTTSSVCQRGPPHSIA